MAIGSPDKAARIEQLRAFARVQVWSGFRSDEQIRGEVYDALRDELKEPARAQELTDEFVRAAVDEWSAAQASWPAETDFDRLQAAFDQLEAADVVVLQACDDHWSANEALERRAAAGEPPRGVAFFTHTDVWHAVEHGMLEVNLWHGDSANVAEGDELLAFVQDTLARHGISSLFDEGRIEVSVAWQRRSGRSR